MSEQALNISPPASRSYSHKEWLAYFLFWSWNLIFVAFMGLGFGPVLLPETIKAVRTGLIPGEYVMYVLVLALIPLAAVVLGLTRLRREPGRLLAMGYVVEGPLMLLLAVRLFLIRQATPAVTVLLLTAFLGMAAFLWDVLSPEGRRLKWLRLVGLSLMAATALYAAAWMAFYALPVGAEIVRWLWNVLRDLPAALRNLSEQITSMYGNQLYMLPFSVLGFLLLAYTASLFIVAPIAVPFYSLRAWLRSIRRLSDHSGWAPPALLAGVTLVVVVLVFIWSNRQPQGEAFALLKNPPASVQQAQELVKHSQEIREGLLNSYLARYRYLSAVGEVLHIRNMYESAFKMAPQQAFAVQALYDEGDVSQNWLLRDGDVLHVPSREENKVFVLGEVRQPSSKVMARGRMSLAEALGDSAGFDPLTSNGAVYVFRGRYEAPQVYRLDAWNADALLLAVQFQLEPHDVVYVTPYKLTSWNRVVTQILPTIQGLWQAVDLANRGVDAIQVK